MRDEEEYKRKKIEEYRICSTSYAWNPLPALWACHCPGRVRNDLLSGMVWTWNSLHDFGPTEEEKSVWESAKKVEEYQFYSTSCMPDHIPDHGGPHCFSFQ